MWVLRWADLTWRESEMTVADASLVCQLAGGDAWTVLDPRSSFGILLSWLTAMELRADPRDVVEIRNGLSVRTLSEVLESVTTEEG